MRISKFRCDNGAKINSPYRITIFGESAGSAAVSAHVLSPKSRVSSRAPLFRRAIMQSGVLLGMAALPSKIEVGEQAHDFASAAGCPDGSAPNLVSCLRRLSVSQLQTINSQNPTSLAFGPVVDGHFLTHDPETLLLTARRERALISEIEVIVGWNSDEGSLALFFGEFILPQSDGVESRRTFRITDDQFRKGVENFQVGGNGRRFWVWEKLVKVYSPKPLSVFRKISAI